MVSMAMAAGNGCEVSEVIDKAGYRFGVGIILINNKRQVFFAKRVGMILLLKERLNITRILSPVVSLSLSTWQKEVVLLRRRKSKKNWI